MKIGQVAAASGVSVDTVRYYERRGVIPEPGRRPSGYREYTAGTIERITRARRLQQMGFTLDEIIDALQVHDTGEATCASERWRLNVVLDRIDAQIAELRELRRSIHDARDWCVTGACDFVSPPAPQ